jgi:hypothetical protein
MRRPSAHYVLAGKHFSRDSSRRQPLIPSVALFKNYDLAAEGVPRITCWPSDGQYEVAPLGYALVIDHRWCRSLRSDSEDVAIRGRAATMRHQSLETAETAVSMLEREHQNVVSLTMIQTM